MPGAPESESASVMAAPPVSGTFFSLPDWTKAIHSPSGENVKFRTFSVPPSGVAS